MGAPYQKDKLTFKFLSRPEVICETDDVRSGTRDMNPLVPRLLSLPPSRKEEEREPWERGCPHRSSRCEPIRWFAPSLVRQNIYAIKKII